MGSQETLGSTFKFTDFGTTVNMDSTRYRVPNMNSTKQGTEYDLYQTYVTLAKFTKLTN
ncbi:UNVERIFIED_CONTAM: hypothetical protein Slati_1973500 [Sesamum latifolium]|uniref:Uncharacterized protein n=1 Tax=Sesamum latifolium TaxID=2727402 RepID=A0AAW2WLT4_9LAMI